MVAMNMATPNFNVCSPDGDNGLSIGIAAHSAGAGIMEYKDYYKILNVERGATADEIKRSYRKLSREFHPDINKEPTAEAKFKEIGEASEVLSDTEKRAAYATSSARNGSPGRNSTRRRTGTPASSMRVLRPEALGQGCGESTFSDLCLAGCVLRALSSGGRSGEFGMHAARTTTASIVIDLRDAFAGATRQISLRMPEIDNSGHLASRKNRTLNVEIPKGVTEGQQIRLKGQGSPGTGRLPAGDLYLEIRFKPDPFLSSRWKGSHFDLPVAPWGSCARRQRQSSDTGGGHHAGAFRQDRRWEANCASRAAVHSGFRARETFYAVLKIVLPPADTETAKMAYQRMAVRKSTL